MSRTPFLVAGIEVAIASLVGYNGVYVPQQRQVRLAETRIADEKANQQMRSEVAVLLNRVEPYRARLAQEPDPSLLVREVVELARQSGVELTSIARRMSVGFPPFARLEVHLQGTASYHELGEFLDALEHAERFLRVDQFRIGYAASGHPRPSVQVVVSTLYAPPLLADAGARGL